MAGVVFERKKKAPGLFKAHKAKSKRSLKRSTRKLGRVGFLQKAREAGAALQNLRASEDKGE
jgi:hypothetical protein